MKLAILYTDNAFPEILNLSLETINKASKDIKVITCANIHIENNPFEELIVNNPIRNHYNIIEKILTAINYSKTIGDYKYVSFLEHDVLYPEGYFDYPDFVNVIYNENYKGLCREGFQERVACQLPLHQMTMTVEFALNHFNALLKPSKTHGVEVEPRVQSKYTTIHPAVHINHGRNFTSHYNCYSKQTVPNNDYWGNYLEIWNKI